MRAAIRRLQEGKRWWAAEVVFRLLAAVFLRLSFLCFRDLGRSVELPLAHQASAAEFALSAGGVVLGWAALACLLAGPGLFRLVPYPRRRLF
ncbi:hypothetical protein H7F51_04640 [Novosphingobium flavum]|uniref:Uncharacterized protein n=1 Tax=Novosphingobium flavum TaxID=1778672 RepID=A0A7X1FPX8_9SPHN|nr:hypothetical protein [Novosphingobium flavum]MBC2664801.1 hypothetical protein [Novosphingobium flavum]